MAERKSTSVTLTPLVPGIEPGAPWWRQIHPIYWAPMLVVFFAVLFTPYDVLDRYEHVRSFCAELLRLFPFLEKHARISQFSQVTTAVKCISFSLVPVFAALPFLVLWKHRRKVLGDRIEAGQRPPKSFELFGLCALAMIIVVQWMVPGEPAWCQGCETRSLLGLAFLTSSALGLIGFAPIAVASAFYVRLGFWFGTRE